MNSKKSKEILNIVAFTVIVMRHIFPHFQIDAINLALIVLILLLGYTIS